MWAVALENPKNFEKLFLALNQDLKGPGAYTLQTSGTGAQIAKAPDSTANGPLRPHFFLVDSVHAELTKHAISWVHKNLHPTTLISSDLCSDWRVGFDPKTHEASLAQQNANPEPGAMIPFSCLRSAGRIDMGGGPILFEEIPFDTWTQAALKKQCSETQLNSLSQAKQKIFGSDRLITKTSEALWLSDNLRCQSYDTFSSELLLAGKRLGLKIGCIKFYDTHPNALSQLLDFWVNFRIPA